MKQAVAPQPKPPSSLRRCVAVWLVWSGMVASGWAQSPPSGLAKPGAGLRPKPETPPAVLRPPKLPEQPAAPVTVPEELTLIPNAPPTRAVRARPPVTTPPLLALPLPPRPPVALLPRLPLPPSFGAPPPPLSDQAPSTSPLLRERFAEARSLAGRVNVRERAAEVPFGLQRHPTRDAFAAGDGTAFTLRSPGSGEVAAQLSLGLLTEMRFSTNLDAQPREFAREDTVIESTPQIRLQLGSPPGPRSERSLDSEAYLQLEYLPTLRQLLGAGTQRVLQRVRAEVGRANAISTAALRFEYDENLFALGGVNSPEDSYTLLELAPRLEYRLTPHTQLRALATYDRIRVENRPTDRADYILDLGYFWDYSVKTQLGAGVEVRHIDFDESALGEVNYEFGYLSLTWRATAKLLLQARGGAEFRQVDRENDSYDAAQPAGTVLLNWQPQEGTSITAAFRARNQPSVTGLGELYRDLRFGLEATRDLGSRFYVRGEVSVRQRDYDSGRNETECFIRPSLGYRPRSGTLFDSLRVELFFQYRMLDSNIPGADFEQNVVGVQTLIVF